MNQDLAIPPMSGVDQPFRKLKLEIAQTGTSVPTLTREFRNTLNNNKVNPTFARTSAGLYTLTMANGFQGNIFGNIQVQGGSTGFSAEIEKTSANVLTIRIFDAADAAVDLAGTVFLDLEVWPA